MTARGGIYGDLHGDGREVAPSGHRHAWTAWEIVGHTGDWFHPHIVKRRCKICDVTETDEH